MPYSHDVQFWKLARLRRTSKRKRVYGVRWVVAGKAFSKWFEYEAQADSYRSKLMQAARFATRQLTDAFRRGFAHRR